MALRTRAAKFGLDTGIDATQLCRASAASCRTVHRHGRAAEQGHRRRERVRARVGHPPGRHAQAPGDLRDHAPGERRRGADAARARQALGAARRSRRGSPSSATPSRRRGARSRRSSASRRSPIASKQVADADLEALRRRRAPGARDERSRSRVCRSRCGTHGHGRRRRCGCARPTAASRVHAAVGTGPVDAAYKAIDAHASARRRRAPRVRRARGDRGHRRARRGQRPGPPSATRGAITRSARRARAACSTATAPTPTSSSPARRRTSRAVNRVLVAAAGASRRAASCHRPRRAPSEAGRP